MKGSLVLLITGWLSSVLAFAPSSLSLYHHHSYASASFKLCAAVELEPEPAGGEELQTSNTVPGCRIKKMDAVPDITSKDGDVYEFWLTAVAEAAMITEIRTTVLKDASKKANFPGFRKGQVPPYALPQITGFAVQESIIKTVQSAVDAYGLKSLPGSSGEVTVKESVTDMAKGYKQGESLRFTATLKAAMPKTLNASSGSGGKSEAMDAVEESDVIDAEVEKVL
jgi:hypothetical protein